MARNKKNKQEGGMNQEFYELYKNSPTEIQMMLDNLGISSLEDLAGLATLMGIDLDKMINYENTHEKDEFPSFEDVKIDGYKPSKELINHLSDLAFANDEGDYYDEDEEDESLLDDYDPFALPESPFIGDEAKEYHIRIKLNNAPVPIWRELKLPSNLSLEAFSFIINEAMGWDGTHLHHFINKNVYYKSTTELYDIKEMGIFPIRIQYCDTNNFAISHLLREKGDRIKYEYDFGDSWLHDVWLKGVREYEPNEARTLTFVKGEGACPPDDCGGVWGYQELLELNQKKRKTADEKEMLNWNGIDKKFDPNDCNPERIEDYLEGLWCELTGK